jgi:hypothetical protein
MNDGEVVLIAPPLHYRLRASALRVLVPAEDPRGAISTTSPSFMTRRALRASSIRASVSCRSRSGTLAVVCGDYREGLGQVLSRAGVDGGHLTLYLVESS